ncbi:MAG: class I SAM-dependent methyltransferase [Sulfurimonas sp.]|nr:class I SAM-dependent methyltransferase [Sulfurimonas sp.]
MNNTKIFNNSYEILSFFKNTEFKSNEIIKIVIKLEFYDQLGIKPFVDLAQIYKMKLILLNNIDRKNIELSFKKLNEKNSFHKTKQNDEKYGVESDFFKIDKTSQFSFLYHYQEALIFCDIKSKNKILNLGINKGDEFEVIRNMLSEKEFNTKEFVGIDYSATIIKYAQDKFPHTKMIEADINRLDEINLGKFDMIISIGTLQSSNINFNPTFMSLYQNHLNSAGAIILGFPNCRWIDGEMIYGSAVPNYNFSEMSMVLKDIHFCKKYLQQKGYRVVITGKEYLFLSARKITK